LTSSKEQVTSSAAADVTASYGARASPVVRFPHGSWASVTGFLVQAERTGVQACVADPGWAFMMTSQFICTPAELADGVNFRLYLPGSVPPGTPVVATFRIAIATVGG